MLLLVQSGYGYLIIGCDEILDLANLVECRFGRFVGLGRRNEKDVAIGQTDSGCATSDLEEVHPKKGTRERPDGVGHLPKFRFNGSSHVG